ncbi:coagulation factor VIII isoform X1 [Xiphophorus hellerii]|uniref:coagulation factor VIII isoform X1 n=1 Tax=Xiphophorus hellerii TaxID=8084 RepID=UPI0013B3D9AF|nr:coagulation factor VIII-like isoform X1 [Xiphophorus hellerii]
MRTQPLLLLPLLLCCSAGEAQQDAVREYFIAAVEIGWDYIHLDDGGRASEQRQANLRGNLKTVPQKYIKAVYREYTDATFTVPRPRPAWTGIQGPVIVAQAGERVVIHFKNLASQPYSISPVGITYWKQSEGAGYDDSTAGQEKEDDAVQPGGYYEYVWDISFSDGPTISDPDCLTYSYSSQVDTVRDMNSGLIGALLICKSRAFTEDGQRRLPAFVLLFAVFDETKSWYGQVGERTSKEKFRRSDGRKEYHTINGYINATLPGLTMCQGNDLVSWHMIGLGTTPEIHSIRFQGHTLQVLTHRKVTVEVTPMTFITAEMRPATKGQFLISCQIHAHRYDGMNALFTVEKCPEPVTKELRKVKEEDLDHDYVFDIQQSPIKKPQVQPRSGGGPSLQVLNHYIAAEEVTWNYAPHLKPTDSQLQSRYLPSSPHHLGYTYKKVVYVEYTDGSFTVRKNPSRTLLGPLLKGRVNDQISIAFRNLASRPFNIYPNGLTEIVPGPGYNDTALRDLRTLGVPPNRTFVYTWKLTSDDGPLDGDPQCLTQLYQSTISPEQDLASGLVGTLLICKPNAIDRRGNLLGPDQKQSLIFAVFDENRSWYFKENMKRSTQSSYNTTDPDFYESNVIYSINGTMFSGRQFVMCQTDVSFWHVANVGTQSEFLSVYFTGNLFQYQGLYQSVLTLFPMTAVTIPMEAEVIGEWEISAFDSKLRSRGMTIRYTVRVCKEFSLVDRDEDEDISEYMDKALLQPRGLRPQNGTMLVRVCKKPVANNTVGQNVTLGEDAHGLCQLKRVPAASVKREQVPSEVGIPEDVLEEVDRDGGWATPENLTKAELNRGGRQKREAGGNWTENNDITLNGDASESQQVRSENLISPVEEMGENYIYSESEGLLDDLLDLEYNFTDGNTTEVNLSFEYDDYNSEVNGSSEIFGTGAVGPRSGETKPRNYYIAADEITWDYGIKTPNQFIKPREMRRGMRKFLPHYTKVVYRSYVDKDFKQPINRGELEEHLGIIGPVIRTEVNDLLTVTFKNNAKRPYSLHLHGVYDRNQHVSPAQSSASFGIPGEPVPPGQTRTYNWKISEKQGPSDPEFNCKTGAYYSTVDKERDLHSGLIGPLVICKSGTLQTYKWQNNLNMQPDIQDFSLLFHTFDETKSWYHEENLLRYCSPPCQANTQDPWYHTSNKFAAINGYVAETLPGLVVAQHQPVRWHLLNVGGDREYHAVHFHGLPFTVHAKQEHRMGVFNLFPGVFGTVEMKPPTVGTWLVECTIGEYQLAGMRAKLLVYDPKCVLPLGMKSGRIEDSQITASDHSGNWEPRLARLDMTGFYNAWMGKGTMSWLQVDLLRPTLLHGIQTQGVSSKLRDHYTATFKVSYSLDQETWTTYRGKSSINTRKFRGNLDSSKTKENSFSPPFVARYIRIHPHDYKQKPALRLELLGCDLNSCSLPLGLEKGSVPDSSFSASSFHSSFLRSWSPFLARLHQSGGANAWRPKNNNPHEWLQVDLGKAKRITGIITQGARSMLTQMMVTEFSVTFSQDRHSWSSVLEESSQREKIFTGNNDPDEEVFTVFEPPLFARYLRIHPRGWVNDIALRLEVLGCDTQRGVELPRQ